jgi:hypothetical protein
MTTKDIATITAPACPACKLEPDNAVEEGFKEGFLALPIPSLGIMNFICPRCFCMMANKECFKLQKEVKRAAESRIITFK